MAPNRKSEEPPVNLRDEAEKIRSQTLNRSPDLSGKTLEEIIHELRVHQIELGIQNEELRRAQIDLETERDRYIELFEFAPVGYFSLTSKAQIAEVNLTGATMLGENRQKLINIHFRNFVAPMDHAGFDCLFLEILKIGGKNSGEIHLIQGNGEEFPAWIEGVRVEKNDGSFQIRISISDISERKRTEQALKEGEAKYHALFEAIADTVFLIDQMTGNIMDVNPSASRVYGYDREEFIRMNAVDLSAEPEETNDSVKNPVPNIPLRYHHRKDGSVFPVELTSSPFELQGTQFIVATVRDITERIRMEEALKVSEARTQLALSGSETGMWELNLSTMTGTIDNRAAQLLGYEEDEIGYRSADWDRLSHPEDVPLIKQRLADYLAGRTAFFESEHRMRHASGDWIWVVGKGKITSQMSDGTALQISGTIHDITTRKRIELELAIAQDRLNAVLRLAHTGIFSWDIKSDTMSWSEELFKIAGRDPSLPAPSFADQPHHYAPGSWVLLNDAVARAHMTKEPFNLELKFIRPDGSIRWTNAFFAVNTDSEGNIAGFHGIVQDITEQREAEEALRESNELFSRFMRHSPILTYIKKVTPAEGRFIQASDNFQTVVGIPGRDMIGRSQDEFFPAEYVSKVTGDDWDIIQKGEASESDEDLKGRTYTTIKFPVVLKGEPFLAGFSIDVTERKRAEEAVHEANQKLRLLTGLTRHDIFNQLTVVEGLQSLMSDESNSDKKSEYLSRFSDVCRHIEATIEFTRKYEKLGLVSSRWERISPIIESAEDEISFGDVTVDNLIPGDLEIYVDPIIQKVFTTLMENAIRHGGSLTTIRLSSTHREGSLVILVEDDGVGIPGSEKERIFDHGHGKHTGIGLFLSREILSITGLSIRETGEEGTGARFEITIPAGKFRRAEG